MKLAQGNIPCLEYAELVPEIMSETAYKLSKHRGKIQTIGRGGNGNQVLVVYDSLPLKYRAKIDKKLGNPNIKARIATIGKAFEFDRVAEVWFKDHALDDGRHLTDEQIEKYANAASMLNTINRFEAEGLVKKQFLSKSEFWQSVTGYIKEKKISLPKNYSRLLPKIDAYNKGEGKNYHILISNNFCNDYSEKVDEQMLGFMLAKMASPVNPIPDLHVLLAIYNQEAEKQGKKPLESTSTLYHHLSKPANEKLWKGPRQGYLNVAQKYGYRLRTRMPDMRDSLWYGDGTKLNFFDQEGKLKASYTVYEISDAYSETLIGYHIDHSENFSSQFLAFKMAVKTSGHKPYELRFDNQGGHKKLFTSDFLNKIARLSIKTRPYNPSSKTIESIFGRFQSHYMARHWFYTGQNVTTKKDSSHMNKEFVIANLKNLPTIEELEQVYINDRKDWNNAPHPKTGIPRIEMYRSSSNDQAMPVQMWDMVDLFWLTTPKPITYRAGINITLNKMTFEFEVLKDGMPDADFRRRYTHERFFVKYDPDDMTFVLLYESTPAGLQFVAKAEERIVIQRNIQQQQPGEMKKIKALNQFQKDELLDVKDEIESLMKLHGTDPESHGLKSAKIPGMSRKKTISVGTVLKEESLEDYQLSTLIMNESGITNADDYVDKM